MTAAPVGTRAAPVPENARRPDQNNFCNASMKLAPAGARLGTRVFYIVGGSAILHTGDCGARRHPRGTRSKKCTPPRPESFLQCFNEVGTRWRPPRHPRVLQQVVGGSAIFIIARLSIYITN